MNAQLLFSLALRSFAPALLALVVVAAWRKSSASNRRMVWLMSFIVLAILPLALLKMPTASVVNKPRSIDSTISALADKSLVVSATNSSSGSVSASSGAAAQTTPSLHSTPPARPTANDARRTWFEYGLLFWAFGALLVLAHWMIGLVRLSQLQLLPVEDDRVVTELKTASRLLGLQRLPRLSICAEATAPMVFGHFRPNMVLPIEAKGWSREALQAVFLHECAHIRRSDWLGLMFSRLVTAVYWFNPLAWLALTQFRAECEAAADDAVLLNGIAPASYASELLRIAMDAQRPAIANSLALVEAGPLKKRIERVLERDRSRGSASPRAIALSIVFSLALSAVCAFSYQVIDGPLVSHSGRADLGKGNYARIFAIVKRTAAGTVAWNMRGELLPNSIPLPDRSEYGVSSNPNIRYIVFTQNKDVLSIQQSDQSKVSGQDRSDSFTGDHYNMARLDGEPISFKSYLGDGSAFASIRCKVLDKAPTDPLEAMKAMRHARVVVFDHVPMNPTGPATASIDLDGPSPRPAGDTQSVGALIGVVDLEHPEWGFWRPDGTPMPPIPGVTAPRFDDGPRAKRDGRRRIGLLFRGRPDSIDWVTPGDASGLDLCKGIDICRTPRGRYDLNEVYVNQTLVSLNIASKAPQADRMVTRLSLTPTSLTKAPQTVTQFFANGIARGAAIFDFDRRLVPEREGIRRTLQFLDADNSKPAYVGVYTDWKDGAVGISAQHPEKIVAANLLEHGYDYFIFPNVALSPRVRR